MTTLYYVYDWEDGDILGTVTPDQACAIAQGIKHLKGMDYPTGETWTTGTGFELPLKSPGSDRGWFKVTYDFDQEEFLVTNVQTGQVFNSERLEIALLSAPLDPNYKVVRK